MLDVLNNTRQQNNKGPLYLAQEYSANSDYNIYGHESYIYYPKSDACRVVMGYPISMYTQI